MKIKFELGSLNNNSDIWMEESPYVFEIHIREDNTSKRRSMSDG